MANHNNLFKEVHLVDFDDSARTKYWRELGVRIDSNKGKNPDELTSIITNRLSSYSVVAIKPAIF
ncbi:hypothetical protein RZN22_01145 [Bacillaceae bacterium S4-13-58]